jgi:hypothetical protein
LAAGALGVAAMTQAARSATDSTYTGALDGSTDKVALEDFDSLTWTQQRYLEAPLKLTYRAGTVRQAEQWQKQLREKVTELIGGFPL